jgi:hypothetical protein
MFNNLQMGYKFYSFDINEPGTGSVQLSNRYTFNTWKGYAICVRNIVLDRDAMGLQFIPLDSDCQKTFPDDFAKFDDVCPINYLELTYPQNEHYDPKNTPSNFYNYSFTKYTTKDEKVNDKYLYLDFEKAFFKGCSSNLNITSDYFYYVNEPTNFYIMPADQNWGVKDEFTRNISWNNFEEYWQDYTNKFSMMPGFLNDSSMSNFYQLVDKKPNTDRVVAYLAMYDNFAPSGNCIQKLMFDRGRYDWVNYLNGADPNYTENILTIIIWNLVSVFMAVYCSISLRFRFIWMLMNGQAKDADKRDESIMKFSHKVL